MGRTPSFPPRLSANVKGLSQLLRSEPKQMERIGAEIADIRKAFGKDTPLGRRRSDFAEAPATADIAPEQMIAREPITVVCSEKGWIRALKGRSEEHTSELQSLMRISYAVFCLK